MNPKIEQWYAEKKLPIDRIIDIGAKRFAITDKPAIIVALEEEYAHRIQPRKIPLRDIDIAWSVWNRARKIVSHNRLQEASEKFGADQARIEELSSSLHRTTSEYASLVNNFDSRLNLMNEKYGEELRAKFNNRIWGTRIFYWSIMCIMLAYILLISGVFETWKV